MKRAELPPFFDQYHAIDGVLKFHVFHDVRNLTEAVALDAIVQSRPDIDRETLRAIGCRTIDEIEFLGNWYDPARKALIQRGSWKSADGREFENPILADLEGVEGIGGSFSMDCPIVGGNFAYAFSFTPYGLRAGPLEVQRIFDSIKMYLLPPGLAHTIQDWSDPRLPEASDFFRLGMEWWGVFLFVVFVPELQRLVVILGSTTD